MPISELEKLAETNHYVLTALELHKSGKPLEEVLIALVLGLIRINGEQAKVLERILIENQAEWCAQCQRRIHSEK